MISIWYWASICVAIFTPLCELSFPFSVDVCLLLHTAKSENVLLWAVSNLFSLSQIFFHSQHVLLLPNLQKKKKGDMNSCTVSLLQHPTFPSLLIQRKHGLSSFTEPTFCLHSWSHHSCGISSYPMSSTSPDSLPPLMHLRYQFSRGGRWMTSNLLLLPKWLLIYPCTFKRSTHFCWPAFLKTLRTPESTAI